MEVILPDGSLWRSGMGGLPNPKANKSDRPDQQAPNEAWGLFNYGFGPYNDGIFSQSSLGIVVKMGIWLMVNPGGYESVSINLARYSVHAVQRVNTFKTVHDYTAQRRRPTCRY